MHTFRLLITAAAILRGTGTNALWVNDCDINGGDSEQAGDLARGSYFCEIDSADNFTSFYETVSGSRTCYTANLEPTGYYWKSSYEDYYDSPFAGSIKQKCGEWCVTIGSSCRGFSIRAGSGTLDTCFVHTSDPDTNLSPSSSYAFNGPFDDEFGYTIATASVQSGRCYVKVGRRSDFTTTSTTRTGSSTTKTKTTTTINKVLYMSTITRDPEATRGAADRIDRTTTSSRVLGDGGVHPDDIVMNMGTSKNGGLKIDASDDITDRFEANAQSPREEYMFTRKNEIIIFKEYLPNILSHTDTGTGTDKEGLTTKVVAPSVQEIVGGQAFELHNGGPNGFTSVADVLQARSVLEDSGSATSNDKLPMSFTGASFDLDRGSIVVDIADKAALDAIIDAATTAKDSLLQGVGPNYNWSPGRGRGRRDNATNNVPVRPHAGWVKALLGDSVYNELYTEGEMDNVQLVITRQRKPQDGPELGPVMPRRDEFADSRKRIGAGSSKEPVILIFNPQSHQRPVPAKGSGAKFDKSVQRAAELMRGGCFKQVKSAVGIQFSFLSQQRGHGVKLATVEGEQGCARVDEWCTGAPDEVAGIDFAANTEKGPPLNRCVMPSPCRSAYDPNLPAKQQQGRFCVIVVPCRDSAECPDPIKSTTELRLAAQQASEGGGVATACRDFACCARNGNPIMESYPEQCHDPNGGKTFTKCYPDGTGCDAAAGDDGPDDGGGGGAVDGDGDPASAALCAQVSALHAGFAVSAIIGFMNIF